VPDPQLDAFLRDMSESIRQQPQGLLSGELLKMQANMMQQQIDLQRENQHTTQVMMQNWSKQGEVKKEMAQVLAPVMEIMKEIKSMYVETKELRDIAKVQIEQLEAERRTRPVNQPDSAPVVRSSIDRFAARKAQLEAKVAEVQRLVDTAAVNDGGITTALEGLTYLRSQMQSLPQEFDGVERDIQTRFLRLCEITQKAKAVQKEVLYPSPDLATAREVLMKRMGGAFDYAGYLRRLDEMKDERNALMLEFKQTAPQYPLIPRPAVQQTIAEKPTKKTAKRTTAQAGQRAVKPAPVPQVQTRRTLTKKPPGISDILSDPIRPPPAVTKKGKDKESPREPAFEVRKPTMVSQETQAEVKKESPRVSPRRLVEDEERKSEEIKEVVEPPKPSQPDPFQLAEPTTKKRIQPEDLLPNIYTPPIHPPPPSTSTPPLQTWERQTLEVLTDYVLTRRLQLAPAPTLLPQGLSRWLGPDQLNTLIKEGLFVDSATIDRMGLEVLDEIIGKVKLDISQREAREEEPNYGSDFEDEISEHTDKSEELKAEEPAYEYKGQAAEPANVSVSFPGPSPILGEERKDATDIAALLSPDILSRMSVSAVRQYMASLIEAGHIGPKTENLSPPLPTVPQPVSQPIFMVEERKHEEPREEELEKILGKEKAAMFLVMLREKHQEMTQEMLDRFARSFAVAEPPIPPAQPLPSPPPEPQRSEPLFPVSTDFKDAFSLPRRLNLDLDAEEAKLRMEQDLPRLMLKLPPFRPPEMPASESNMSLYLSASESSIGEHSVGTELFSLENTEYMGSLAQFMGSARGMEEGQLAGNPELSEGEVGGKDEALSSGELPPDVLNPGPGLDFPKPRINVADIFASDAALDSASEGEFDPQHLFHP
jgi:hypothetical protein